jgi:hypothetical protein
MSNPVVVQASDQYPLYPSKDEAARILDIGFDGLWFLAAGLKLGDSDLSAADFNTKHKDNVRAWLKTSSGSRGSAARGNLVLQLTNGLSGFYTGNFPWYNRP